MKRKRHEGEEVPMQNRTLEQGCAKLRAARGKSHGLYWIVALFSLFTNILMLTGPIYLLQVYDRVLGIRDLNRAVFACGVFVRNHGCFGYYTWSNYGTCWSKISKRNRSLRFLCSHSKISCGIKYANPFWSK